MKAREKGFLATVFDLSFGTFVTAKLIRGLYRLIIVITANGTVAGWLVAYWLPEWFGWGLKALIFLGAPVAALIWLTITRIALEHLIIIYAIHDKATIIADNTTLKEPSSK